MYFVIHKCKIICIAYNMDWYWDVLFCWQCHWYELKLVWQLVYKNTFSMQVCIDKLYFCVSESRYFCLMCISLSLWSYCVFSVSVFPFYLLFVFPFFLSFSRTKSVTDASWSWCDDLFYIKINSLCRPNLVLSCHSSPIYNTTQTTEAYGYMRTSSSTMQFFFTLTE